MEGPKLELGLGTGLGLVYKSVRYIFTWQPQYLVPHFPTHLHVVRRHGGMGFIYFDGRSAPKFSSHPCFRGSSLSRLSLAVVRSVHALCTRKAARWI